jgi:hypothetical protein
MGDIINKKDSPYRKKVGPEHFPKEIELMAEMRAFYSYSALRYAEVILQYVETGLLSEFGDLKTKMQLEFRYDDANSGKSNPATTRELWMLIKWLEDYCSMLLEVEPCRLQQRRKLVQQREVLRASLDQLSTLQPESMEDAMDMA